jgi:hypothetical protein
VPLNPGSRWMALSDKSIRELLFMRVMTSRAYLRVVDVHWGMAEIGPSHSVSASFGTAEASITRCPSAQARPRRHRVETQALALQLRSFAGLAQTEDAGEHSNATGVTGEPGTVIRARANPPQAV